jgi:hypothetical protein
VTAAMVAPPDADTRSIQLKSTRSTYARLRSVSGSRQEISSFRVRRRRRRGCSLTSASSARAQASASLCAYLASTRASSICSAVPVKAARASNRFNTKQVPPGVPARDSQWWLGHQEDPQFFCRRLADDCMKISIRHLHKSRWRSHGGVKEVEVLSTGKAVTHS